MWGEFKHQLCIINVVPFFNALVREGRHWSGKSDCLQLGMLMPAGTIDAPKLRTSREVKSGLVNSSTSNSLGQGRRGVSSSAASTKALWEKQNALLAVFLSVSLFPYNRDSTAVDIYHMDCFKEHCPAFTSKSKRHLSYSPETFLTDPCWPWQQSPEIHPARSPDP